MSTMLPTRAGSLLSPLCAASTPLAQMIWPSISAGVRLRAQPSSVEAQNAQPIRQPTCVDRQSVLPYL